MHRCACAGGRFTTTPAVIEFRSVSKDYRPILGRVVTAVEDFSLHVSEGEVLGIAGPNGAGKSTLMALLLGFTRPSHGEICIDGLSPRAYVERNGIGYLSELIQIPPRWRAENSLRRYALLSGAGAGESEHLASHALERLGLEEHRGKRVKALSKGNLQRLGFAQAMLVPHRVYVFDEPTHGLDPVWTQRFRGVVGELRTTRTTVVIASHNLDELQRLADRVVIIDHGQLQRIVSTGLVADVSEAVVYRIVVAEGADEVSSVFPSARRLARGRESGSDTGRARSEIEIRASDLRELNRGMAELIARGVVVVSVGPAESELESQFREVVANAAAARQTSGELPGSVPER